MEDEESDALRIIQQCNAFSNRFSQLSAQSELFVIFGGHKSGKSITVDLLAGRKLKIFEDPQLAAAVIVSQQNLQRSYPKIYIASTDNIVAMQSFTLGEDLQVNSFQVIKLIYLEQFLKKVGKVSYVVVCDQMMIDCLHQLIENFLHCIGITSERIDERIHIVTNYLSLFITKIEPQMSEEDYLQTLNEQKQITTNENVAQVISWIIQNKKIALFKIQNPSPNFASNTRKKFALKSNGKQLAQLLENSSLRNQKQKRQLFLQRHQQQIIDLFYNLANMVINLVLFAVKKDNNFRKDYEDIAKQIFPTHKRKNQIQNMIGKWSIQQLKEFQLELPAQYRNPQALTQLLTVFSQLIKSICSHSPEARQDLIQIMNMMAFCSRFRDWLDPQLISNKIHQIINSLEQLAKQLKQSSPKKQVIPSIHKSSSKRKNTPYSAFKQLIQTCSSNKNAIQTCISVIKEKEVTANYDHYDVIYYIKLLRDLLEHLNQAGIEDQCLFINELIEIALYTENWCNLGLYLAQGIQNSLFDQNSSLNLIKVLLEAKKLDLCQKVIQYAQGMAIDSESFQSLAQLKLIVLQQRSKMNQSVQQKPKVITLIQRKKLSFSLQAISSKCIRSEKVQKMLQQLTFQKYLINANL